jgi:hypothetical protein
MAMYEPEFDPGMVDPGLLDPALAGPPVAPPIVPFVEAVAPSPIDVLRDLLEGTMTYLEVGAGRGGQGEGRSHPRSRSTAACSESAPERSDDGRYAGSEGSP